MLMAAVSVTLPNLDGVGPMTTKPETLLVKKLRKELERRGWLVWKIHGSAYQEPGIPDLLCFRDGKALAIEAKIVGNKPSAVQQRQIARLSSVGVPALVIYSLDELIAFLNDWESAGCLSPSCVEAM